MGNNELRHGIVQAGARDTRRAAQSLAAHIPSRLAPLARVAYNYYWSWHPDGHRLFREIDAYRWRLTGQNPVRFLEEVADQALERAATDSRLVERAEALGSALEDELTRPPAEVGIAPEHPVAFFCAEFGVHRSLPIYAGGLGVLAGDILKEASDCAVPMVGVGILYRQGYFHQRTDASGWQHEYWYETDPERRPAVKVTTSGGLPVTIEVPIWGEDVAVHVWRVEVGRVPLFLLDTTVHQNSPRRRFVSARLYEGNRQMRLAQYALLGVGGMRVLRALGIDPAVVHLNEGHPALATLEDVGRRVAQGTSFQVACAEARSRFVFTTHTPVAAGNETYSAEEMRAVFPEVAEQLGVEWDNLIDLGRVHTGHRDEPPGMTPLALRMSRSVNGVSHIHGGVSRAMWKDVFAKDSADDVPITHVTNGVHLPSWMAPSIRSLLDRYLGPEWHAPSRVTDPATWEAVESIPDEELWAARMEGSRRLVGWVRSQTVTERLTRGESMEFVEQAASRFDPDTLTLGFARRLATYKRMHLLVHPERLLRVIDGPRPVQILLAGKAHPLDDMAKDILKQLFALKKDLRVAGRVAFLDDYDMGKASMLVYGCDVWVNLPRPPQEASGTSGMKAAFNGGLNLSVLDGWWAEAYDGVNGWAIDGTPNPDEQTGDARDAQALYDLLEREIIPLFYDRDAGGVPRGWVKRMKAALRTLCPRFCATRMLDEYVGGIYRPGA